MSIIKTTDIIPWHRGIMSCEHFRIWNSGNSGQGGGGSLVAPLGHPSVRTIACCFSFLPAFRALRPCPPLAKSTRVLFCGGSQQTNAMSQIGGDGEFVARRAQPTEMWLTLQARSLSCWRSFARRSARYRF